MLYCCCLPANTKNALHAVFFVGQLAHAHIQTSTYIHRHTRERYLTAPSPKNQIITWSAGPNAAVHTLVNKFIFMFGCVMYPMLSHPIYLCARMRERAHALRCRRSSLVACRPPPPPPPLGRVINHAAAAAHDLWSEGARIGAFPPPIFLKVRRPKRTLLRNRKFHKHSASPASQSR